MHEQGRFADARLSTDEDDAAGHAIQLAPGQGPPRGGFGLDLVQRHGPAATWLSGLAAPSQAALNAPAAPRRCFADLELLKRVPGVAVRALPGPTEALAPAFRAHEGHSRLRHQIDSPPIMGFLQVPT